VKVVIAPIVIGSREAQRQLSLSCGQEIYKKDMFYYTYILQSIKHKERYVY